MVVAALGDKFSGEYPVSSATGYSENNEFSIYSPEEENATIAFVAAAQSPAASREAFFFAQSRCEKCAAAGEKFYLFRPLSDLSDVRQLRFVGVTLKPQFVTNELLPQIFAASPDAAREFVFGAFDERGQLVFSNAAIDSPNFEVRHPLAKTFSRWTIAGGFRDERIENLTRSYFYRNLLLLLLLFSLLVVGLALILSVTTKEVELAAAKSAFVSNVSHELKTPLSLIRLFAETLEAGRVKSPEKAQEYYGIISRETNRLTALINNILDFAAI